MKVNESNQIITDKISIFGEVLEFIDTNQIEQIINNISRSSCLSGVIEEEESKYEQDINSSKISFHSSQIKNSRFPCYDGSFKTDINKFLKTNKNRDLSNLYEELIKEIQKMYHGYTHVETKLYSKINQYIQFSDAQNNTPMEIISKLKEISETLLDTIKFIESYLFKNFQILQKIFFKIDQKLSDNYEVESISLFFLLDIFDYPNNELSYMLMFKIIDEETCVLRYITDVLDCQIKNAAPKYNRITENKEPNLMDNEACLLDNKSTLSIEAYTAMINIKEKYINKINESIYSIDSYSYFRAKYYNKYIYTKGNYEVDTNLFLNFIKQEDNDDDNNEEFLPINSLMDEEVVINKFISKTIIKKFLIFFYSTLPPSFKRNQRLIMLHTIQYNMISVFILYWYRNYQDGFADIAFFYLGRIISKIIFNFYLKKIRKIKSLLIISNFLLIVGFILTFFNLGKSNYKWLVFISRFFIGLSYSKNLETKFILNNIPKLLVKKTIKKYYSLIILSISFGFFITSAFNYIFSFIEKKDEDIEKELKEKKLYVNNVGEIIIGSISLIILVINYLFFKEPKVTDLIKQKKSNSNSLRKNSNNNLIKENEIINNIPDNKEKTEDKKDAQSIFSYGKAKLISFKEKNKAKLLDEYLKLDIGQKNYEGTNQIFCILQKLIIKENTSNSSYTNKSTRGYIFFYTLLYIISSLIIFYNPIYNSSITNQTNVADSKKKIWIFGIPYLLSFFIYYFKLIRFSADTFIWNIFILVFLSFGIILSIIFFIFDTKFFNKTPLYFDNYYLYGFLSFILFLNILIELSSLKVMIRIIPIEKKINSINIDNFMDIYECVIKGLTFGILFLFSYYSLIKKIYHIKLVISILYILACFVFLLYNFKRKQISLIKIINKITYESF